MKPKITVIMWDGNFREYIHTIDYFGNQDLSPDEYEILWVDFYDSNDLIRAKPFAYQSAQYRNLEYFLTHMSNGIPYNGPSSRK